MPQNRWVSVFQSSQVHIVEIIKLRLEDEGIKVQVWNQVDSSYNAFGYIHLNVLEENQEKALKIIEELA